VLLAASCGVMTGWIQNQIKLNLSRKAAKKSEKFSSKFSDRHKIENN
jgi:hypothetical protein